MKLCGLFPSFYIRVSVSDLYISTIGPQTLYSKIGGRSWEYINRSQIHEMQKLRTRPRSFISGNIYFEFSVQCGLVLNYNCYNSRLLNRAHRVEEC
jgi:hypothetical protein